MLIKLFFIFTDILGSEPTKQKANPENLSVSTQVVKSLQSHCLDMITSDVNLVFKNGETFKIGYSKLKVYEIFRTEKISSNIITGEKCKFLSKYSLGAFKTFLSLFDSNDDLGMLIMFTNYENLDHIIELTLLLQPNPLSETIINNIIYRKEQFLYFSLGIVLNALVEDENIVKGLTPAMSSKIYHKYIARIFSSCPKMMGKFCEKLSLSFTSGDLSACSNFIITYSMYKPVVFIFNDEFWLHVKIINTEPRDSDPVQHRDCVEIVIISQITEKENFEQLEDQINFIKSLYRRKMGEDFKIEFSMSYVVSQRNSKEFLRFLKTKFNLPVLGNHNIRESFRTRANIAALLDSMKPKFLVIKFKESTTTKTCDKEIEFSSIYLQSIVNRLI